MTEPDVVPRPEPVVMRVPPPEAQSRATILLRIVLVVPHVIVLYLFSAVATVAGVLGWLAALFLGRLPDPFYRFLRSWTRTVAQLSSYVWLLTGRYPPVIAIDSYVADVELGTSPPRLNRLAVLFRLVLVVPAAVVATVTLAGASVFALFLWLIALVKGRLPDVAHQAVAATLRYSVRYTAYVWLLTPTYPGGLFGDKPGRAAADAEPTHDDRRLILTRGAKRLVAAFVVVGTVGYGGAIAFAIGQGAGTIQARVEVTTAWNALTNDIRSFEEGAGACQQSPDVVACVTGEMGELADGVDRFHGRVAAIDFPADARDEGAELVAAAAAFRDAARQLASARSGEEYATRAQSSRIDTLGERMDRAYTAVLEALDK